MKRVMSLLVVLVVSAFSLAEIHADRPVRCIPLRPVTEKNVPFQAGECLEFDIYAKVGAIRANMAKATLSIDTTRLNGVKVYESKMDGRINKFYNAFFKVRENFSAWLSMDDIRPLKYERDTREGGYTAHDVYVYRWGEDPHIDAQLNSSSKGERSMTLPLDDCTFDVISLFCRVRNLDVFRLKDNDDFVMSFVLGSKAKKNKLVYYGMETVELDEYGPVDTYKFGILAAKSDGTFEDETSESNMFIWFSADQNRVPVKFMAPFSFGSVAGKLSTCSGLKFPFGGNRF